MTPAEESRRISETKEALAQLTTGRSMTLKVIWSRAGQKKKVHHWKRELIKRLVQANLILMVWESRTNVVYHVRDEEASARLQEISSDHTLLAQLMWPHAYGPLEELMSKEEEKEQDVKEEKEDTPEEVDLTPEQVQYETFKMMCILVENVIFLRQEVAALKTDITELKKNQGRGCGNLDERFDEGFKRFLARFEDWLTTPTSGKVDEQSHRKVS